MEDRMAEPIVRSLPSSRCDVAPASPSTDRGRRIAVHLRPAMTTKLRLLVNRIDTLRRLLELCEPRHTVACDLLLTQIRACEAELKEEFGRLDDRPTRTEVVDQMEA